MQYNILDILHMIRGDHIGVTLEELRAYEKAQQRKSKNEHSISPLAWERYKGSGLDINKFIYIYDNYKTLKEKLDGKEKDKRSR